MPNAACYTAVYGAYDYVKPLPSTTFPCYLYTDSQQLADEAAALGWQPRVVKHSITTLNGQVPLIEPMLNHKFWKTHPHLACPDADISLWLDGSMSVLRPDYVEHCLNLLGEDDWACVPHPARECIYDEAYFSATLERYDTDSMMRQIMAYQVERFPPKAGLIATGANVRRHTPAVIEFGLDWWEDILLYSHQDQLSFPVCMHKYVDRIRFNRNLPWHTDWALHFHLPVGG